MKKIDPILTVLIAVFLASLTYAGFLAYRSIDLKILDKLEAAPIDLPTQIVASPTPSPQDTPTPQTTPPHSSTN